MSRVLGLSFLAFLGFAVLLQWRSGAFVAEFSGPDESAHLVTSLMVRDYVASGMPGAPQKFAEDYYLRSPKVAFGIWPPLFHLSQAAWMLLFSPSRISVLILMALWTALLAAGCAAVVRSEFGTAAALCLGGVLVSLPEVQSAAGTNMPDLMMSCFMFGAVLFFGRYLDRLQTRDALMFGILAGIAIMVKYNALTLVLVPPFAVLFTGRFALLRRRSFWLPVAVVAAICGPWYLFNRTLVRYAMEPDPGIGEIPGAMVHNLGTLVSILGLPLLALAAAGALSAVRRGSPERAASGKWIAAASLLAALWFFHSVLYPIKESRYLLAAAPALLLYVAAGGRALAAWIAPRFQLRYATCFAGIVMGCLVYALGTSHVPGKTQHGWSELAAALSSRPGGGGEFILVSGSGGAEGMMVSEMALLDRQRRHCILRASKILARSTWAGEEYQTVFHDARELLAFLDKTPVSIVAVDRSPAYRRPHNRLLREALSSRSDVWAPVKLSKPSSIDVFERIARPPARQNAAIVVDLSRTLGRNLVIWPNKPAAP
jgi:hypothetical protein